jgi:hypothetical protein
MARAAFVRLLAFVVVLFGTFGTAYGLGRRVPGNPERAASMAASRTTFAFVGALAPGTYRLFPEFGYRGDVATTAFTVVQP